MFRGRPSGNPQIPKTLNQKKAKKLLEALGYVAAQGGKHQVKMVKEGSRPITLPENKRRDYPAGLRDAILREAGLKGSPGGGG